MITTRGKLVFVTESFPLDLARKLTNTLLDAQGTGELKMAAATGPSTKAAGSEDRESLTSGFVRFFSNCGVMKAAVDAAMEAGR